jgi:Dynamin family
MALQTIDPVSLTEVDDHLAVVGEFSAGKSTFIDAVLRDPLLKRAPLVTTAAATHLCYSERIDLEVRFDGSPTWLSYSQTPDRIVERVEAHSLQPVGQATLRLAGARSRRSPGSS